jgi:hypothetical protein
MTQQQSARLSLEGLRFRVVPRDPSIGRSPEIALCLTKKDYPAEGLDPFSPLRLPENVEVELRDIDSILLERAHFEVEAHMEPGVHEFPIAGRHPFLVEVLEGTMACANLQVAKADPVRPPRGLLKFIAAPPKQYASGVPCIVRALSIVFSQPVVLRNVFQTLMEVQDLFSDKGLAGAVQAALAATEEFGPRAARLSTLARTFADQADRLGDIHLKRAVAKPVYRPLTGDWILKFEFSGHVHMANRVPFAFDDVVLPGFILPIPFATLDDLLSDRPLASASLHPELLRWEAVARTAWQAIRSYQGKFSLAGWSPGVAVRAAAADQTLLRIGASIASQVTMEGELTGHADGGAFVVESPDIALGFPEPSLHLAIKARLEERGPSDAPLLSRLKVDLENTIQPGSRIPSLGVEIDTSHPLAHGRAEVVLQIDNLLIHEGAGGLSLADRDVELWPMTRRVAFSCDVSSSPETVVQQIGQSTSISLQQGHFEGTVELGSDGLWHLGLHGRTQTSVRTVKEVPDIPEVSIDAGTLVVRLEGDSELAIEADADFLPTNAFSVELRRGWFGTRLSAGEVTLHDRRITLPEQTSISVSSRRGTLHSAGFEELAFDVAWDLHGEPCLLHAGDRSASLLADDLREGEITVHIGAEGKLSFSGEREGLYGIRYFNALLNPMADPNHMLEILRSEEAVAHVFSAIELISPKLAERAALVRDVALGLRTIARRAGIIDLRDLLPRANMARLMSLVLAGDESQAERIAVQIQSVTEARGLDVQELKAILRAFFDDFDADYEIAGMVRWLEGLVSPIAPPAAEQPVELQPLAVQFADQLGDLPSAAQLYQRLQRGEVDRAFTATLCRLAVMLTEDQLEYILSQSSASWPLRHRQWLDYVRAVKRRVNRIAQAYGGIEYALQGYVVALFLGEALQSTADPAVLDDEAWAEAAHWPPACALGPEDVATLLKAGLAIDRQARQTQINNRMLVDLIEQRGGEFLLQVLVEIGLDNPNALSGVLFAFLDQEQDHMLQPVDLSELLERKLGQPVPRRPDYMAGGKNASRSYYEALANLADAIMARTDLYLARKTHLQVQRHAVAQYRPKARNRALIDAARAAIRVADGAATGSSGSRKSSARASRRGLSLYHDAFERCAELLATDPLAFQSPWLRTFWGRNEDALRVLSVVRNYQEDIDRVRPWLHTRSGRHGFATERDLLETVIRTLVHEQADQKRLLADPLVGQLVDPPEGRYDFVVVSCMGVITEGDVGTELEDSYARLLERRGVRVLRAPTGTAMSLEENARRIISIFKLLKSPFGYVGYSQGCANGLAAESMLRGGTPDEQKILQRLVSRNLLFSAFNGSAHGTFGSQKFLRAIVDGERFLKHYQVMFSSEVVGAFLRGVKALMDSPVFVRVLGGVHSLTPARARDFHREMQIVAHAPTSTTRGIVREEELPEALEFTWYMLRHMAGADTGQDTQVTALDALGRSTRVVNDMTRLLERCDMPSACQAIHHWSPLFREVAFVTTERDHERAAYDSPKDRHVFPWIDVNARFGLIKRV